MLISTEDLEIADTVPPDNQLANTTLYDRSLEMLDLDTTSTIERQVFELVVVVVVVDVLLITAHECGLKVCKLFGTHLKVERS